MSEPMLAVAMLSKRYRIFFEKPSLIRSVLPALMGAGTSREFWALRDISFTAAPGECLGIIGSNGSGKSTLLKIIAGVTTPTAGRVNVRGAISSLLELGAGFHPELTGRENVFLNASILGLTRAEIERRFDAIVEFSGLHEFINTKLYTYSSGMCLRLGFAVAIHVPFDLLLIDEIIAVGDPAFQEKCSAHVRQLRSRGKTIVIISHMMGAITSLCDRVLWLDHGRIAASGPAIDMTRQFVAASAGGE
ncbi:MAG TPA: ABC transporter ATP-binding protein [bacterium]|nr:ABC transporter ATP-binding protein [bacterium]